MNQKGLTLIEVLIALVVFSAGILGMTALQMQVKQRVDDQTSRNAAIWKGSELAERIQINKAGIDTYDNILNRTTPCEVEPAVQCSVHNGAAATATCNEDEMATFDVWQTLCADNFGLVNEVKGITTNLTCYQNKVDAEDPNEPDIPQGCNELNRKRLTITWSSMSTGLDPRLGNGASTDSYVINLR